MTIIIASALATTILFIITLILLFDKRNNIGFVVCASATALMLTLYIFSSLNYYPPLNDEVISEAEYTYYLDGIEVDYNKIALSNYRIKWDDDNKIAYLTRK